MIYLDEKIEYKLINLLGHPINIYDKNKTEKLETLKSDVEQQGKATLEVEISNPFRIKTDKGDFQIVQKQFKGIKNLPDPQPKTLYIVNMAVADYATKELNRIDLVGPDGSEEGSVRDNNGFVIGTTRLIKY